METDAFNWIPQLLFHITTLIFVVYTVSLAFHWFAYGDSRSVSMISLMVYLLGSAFLFSMMAFALYAL